MAVSVNIFNHQTNYDNSTTDLYLPATQDVSSEIVTGGGSLRYPTVLYDNDDVSYNVNKLRLKTSNVNNTYKYYFSDLETSFSAIVGNNDREYLVTVTDTSGFSLYDNVTLTNNLFGNDDVIYNGNVLTVLEIVDGVTLRVLADLDTLDYTNVTSGILHQLYTFSIDRSKFFQIAVNNLVDYNLSTELFWVAMTGSVNSFNSIVLINSELLNTDDVLASTDDYGYTYNSEGILVADTSREIAFRKSVYGGVSPAIFIGDVEGTGNSLDFTNNYKFSYEFNVSSIDSSKSIARSEASISGNYIDNILNFAESFTLKAMGDIYEYLSALNLQYNIYGNVDTLIVDSSGKTNKIEFNDRNNEKSIRVRNEKGIYFDSKLFLKKSELSENMTVIFDNLNTKKLNLFSTEENNIGYVQVNSNNNLELSFNDTIVTLKNENEKTIIATNNNKLLIEDEVFVNSLLVQDSDGNTTATFKDSSSIFSLVENKPNNSTSKFVIVSENYSLLSSAVINNVDITSIGNYNTLTSYENLSNDTWLETKGDVAYNGVLVSQKKNYVKINSKNNMELSGNGTLYMNFDKVIVTGSFINNSNTDESYDTILYTNKDNIMTSDSSILYTKEITINSKTLTKLNEDGLVKTLIKDNEDISSVSIGSSSITIQDFEDNYQIAIGISGGEAFFHTKTVSSTVQGNVYKEVDVTIDGTAYKIFAVSVV